jgi:(aminoalkyl)phosphonate N-acetyltransferase
MKLRYALLSDLQEIYSLMCELESKEMPIKEFESIFTHNIDRDEIHYIVIEDKDELIAFGSMHIQKLLHHSLDVAEIQELIIKDSYRCKGIGTKIIDKFKEISKENRCELIEVCCNRKRVDTHKFYQGCGFGKSHYKFTLWH